MKNIIVLGSGRSGTSMVTGTFTRAGYYMGSDIYSPTPTNLKGVFEDAEINSINEEILFKTTFWRSLLPSKWFARYRPATSQRWLQKTPLDVKLFSSKKIEKRIRKMTRETPFCFKDPRFSYSIPIWRPFLKNTGFVCVFRDPASTAMSILKECRSREYLKSLRIDFAIAVEVWRLMYLHILSKHMAEGEWLFLHYNQVLTDEGLNKLKTFSGAKIDRSFPDKKMRTSFSDKAVSEEANDVYKKLCEIANYDEKAHDFFQLQKSH